MQDKSLVRYYTFEEPGDVVRNLAGNNVGTLSIGAREPYFHANFRPRLNVDSPQWTTGRFGGKSALTFRSATSSAQRSLFYGTTTGVLTLETWVRTHANPGEKTEAFLFSVGAGFGDGWLVKSTWYNTSLCIGRKKNQGGDIQLSVKPLTGHVWHHVVAVLDRRELRLYVDGE
ncbi:MAG: hypothetical protein JKX85_11650, partial [Phycisphaeraceae bacterium]|nr:hypothetical protein [Phycisphaeraceae bacterium]